MWENLLRNYVNDLYRLVLIFYVEQLTPNLEKEIAIYQNIEIIEKPIYKNMRIVNNKFIDLKITRIVLDFILSKEMIRKYELYYLISALHPFALKLVVHGRFE